MTDFFTQHQLMIVLAIVLVLWAGIFGYIWKIDRKINTILKQKL